MLEIMEAETGPLVTLLFLSVVFFLENFDRYLIAVSPIPYIEYSSYEYSVLVGPAFTVIYSAGGLFMALQFCCNKNIASMGKSAKLNIIALTTAVFSAAFTSTAFAVNFWQQCIIRIFMGMAQSIVTPFSTSIISDEFLLAQQGSAFSIFNVGTYLSFSLSLSLGTYIFVTYGWRANYIIFGLIGLLFSAGTFLLHFYNKSYTNTGVTSTASSDAAAADTDSKHSMDAFIQTVEASIDGSNKRATNILSSNGNVVLWDRNTREGNNNNNDADDDDSCHKCSRQSEQSKIHQALIQDAARSGKSTWWVMLDIILLLLRDWNRKPGIFTLCLASGIRMGGGYIWSAYTSVFFSDLFTVDTDINSSSCNYSYNSTATNTPNDMCGSDFPYCVDSDCSNLSSFPWHNKGMSSTKLIAYMSWVPLLGSALGSLLGGLLSDYLVKRELVRLAPSSSSSPSSSSFPDIVPGESSHSSNRVCSPINKTFTDTLTSHGEGELQSAKQETEPPEYMWSRYKVQAIRIYMAGMGNFFALPIIAFILKASFPYCFLLMILSGLVGEVYFGQSLVVISSISPKHLSTASVALFMFVVTMIGGNMPLLVPAVASWVDAGDVDIKFRAANDYSPGGHSIAGQKVEFSVSHDSAKSLEMAMMYVLSSSYAVSGALYIISARQMQQSQ